MVLDLSNMRTLILPIVHSFGKELVSVQKVMEFGVPIVQILIDDPNSFYLDIDEVALINEKILDEINDLLPEGYYLEVSSLGAERELKHESDYQRALQQYIYVKTYQKVEEAKEWTGYLRSYDEEKIAMEVQVGPKLKQLEIPRSMIAKIRLAVKF